jgi:CubicO group peptidase (beta-lactamase class C family)
MKPTRRNGGLVVATVLLIGLLLWWTPWSSGGHETPRFPHELAARLDEELKAVLPRSGSAGVQAAVVMADGSVWSGGAGLADVEAKRPMTPDLLIATGSINKMYTAALVLDLAEDGVLSLDAKVERWVPGVPNTRGLTIRQLLTHTSGLGNLTRAGAEETTNDGGDALYAEIQEPKACEPGTCFHYSNANYNLLGAIIEAATGRPYARVLRDRVLTPLGLTATFFPTQETTRGRSATGYDRRDGSPMSAVESAKWYPSKLPNAAGGLVSTARDTALFAHALFGGEVLEPQTLRQMLQLVTSRDLPGFYDCGAYGLGIHRFPLELGGWGHGGSTWHFGSLVWYFPRQATTVALTQTDSTDTVPPIQRLARIALAGAPVIHPEARNGSCRTDLFVRSADGTTRQVTTDPEADESPSWSPDGTHLVWVHRDDDRSDLLIGTLDGSRPEHLTHDPALETSPRWSPDGTRIAFTSNRDGDDEIYAVDRDGTNLVQITDDDPDDSSPAWSPDGSTIAYTNGTDGQVHLISPDGTHDRALTEGAVGRLQSAWSPDGERIAYLSESAMFIVKVDDGSFIRIPLATDGYDLEPIQPSWGPDDVIAFTADGDLWTVGAGGSNPHRLTATSSRELAPAWSHEGSAIAYQMTRWIGAA